VSSLPNQTASDGVLAQFRGSAVFAIVVSSLVGVSGTTLVSVASAHDRATSSPGWTEAQRKLLRSLSLTSLEPLAPDPSNRYGDDPRAAALGRELFFDTRLSGNGKVSCATCHVPSRDLQDGTPLAHGVGTTARRTMPIAGTAHNSWFFWDGRADSQWGQALGPLESAAEHGGTRSQYAHVVAKHYRAEYEQVFGGLPQLAQVPRSAGPVADTASRNAWERLPSTQRDDISRVYANIGKAIAAFERRIEFAPSRFDRYVDAELGGRPHDSTNTLSTDEGAGLRLFIGKANCVNCHNGALFTDNHFHNTAVPSSKLDLPVDSGRTVGVRQALAGEFNCVSRYSDAKPDDCEELRFAVTEGKELVRAYKTPSLRNVAGRAPYMHSGQFATLDEVLSHYNSAPAAPFGKSELRALHLSPIELRQLAAFLNALTTPTATPKGWLEATSGQFNGDKGHDNHY
jgi:cytochrome c peroxidase